MLVNPFAPLCLQMEMAHQVVEALCRLHAMNTTQDVAPATSCSQPAACGTLADFGISDMCASPLASGWHPRAIWTMLRLNRVISDAEC
jgi:hypothetical protein